MLTVDRADLANLRNCRAAFGVGAYFAFVKAVELRETASAKGKGASALPPRPRRFAADRALRDVVCRIVCPR